MWLIPQILPLRSYGLCVADIENALGLWHREAWAMLQDTVASTRVNGTSVSALCHCAARRFTYNNTEGGKVARVITSEIQRCHICAVRAQKLRYDDSMGRRVLFNCCVCVCFCVCQQFVVAGIPLPSQIQLPPWIIWAHAKRKSASRRAPTLCRAGRALREKRAVAACAVTVGEASKFGIS